MDDGDADAEMNESLVVHRTTGNLAMVPFVPRRPRRELPEEKAEEEEDDETICRSPRKKPRK